MQSGDSTMVTKEEIKNAALKLDPAEREALAEELLLSIDSAERAEIDAAWLAEAHRRDADFRAGKTSAKPTEDSSIRPARSARQRDAQGVSTPAAAAVSLLHRRLCRSRQCLAGEVDHEP